MTNDEGFSGCSAFMIIVLSIMLLGVGIVVLNFAFGWMTNPLAVHGVENVKAQYQRLYDDDNAMKALATQHCVAMTATAQETDPQTKTQRMSQQLAITNNYARIQGEYNALMADAFRAKRVAPSDLPNPAPTLQERERTVCGH